MARAFESQYDAERGTVTLVAQTEFGVDRYAVTVPADSPEAAREQARGFVAMYAAIEAA